MKKKTPASRILKLKPKPRPADEDTWHNGADVEIILYAQSLQNAAKTLVEKLDLEPNPKTAWDACPVIYLYRQAVELSLKVLVGEGINFLKSPVDHITLSKTHSLRWLAQLVCQIIKKVKWDSEFKCEGVASLADFSALVAELEALDPVSCAVRSGGRSRDGSVPPQLEPPKVVRLAGKLDALLDLLNAAADGLAATVDMARDGISAEELLAGDDVGETIH
jgi:hypothetical protein